MPTDTALSAAQRLVLTTAAQRSDRGVLPLPRKIGGGRAATRHQRLLNALLRAGLVEERPAGEGPPNWRQDTQGQRFALHATAAGLAAVGHRPAGFPRETASQRDDAPGPVVVAAAELPAHPPAASVRPGGKLGRVLGAVASEAGATLAELVALTGWQPHTARAALTGLRQRGFAVRLSERGGRKAYRIAAAER
jgi:DNA-binding IclR family transcriptional regulator